MKEVAMQELKILEAQHPTGFQYLKLQLKEFIHDLDQDQQQHSFQPKQQSSLITQESSSKKREKDEGSSKSKSKRIRRRGKGGEGINGAIKKAEACLSKIQTFKSFLSRPVLSHGKHGVGHGGHQDHKGQQKN